MPLSSSITAVSRLAPPDIDRMFDLHRRYYDNLDRRRFLLDLREKQWVILLRNAPDEIAGFSTVQTFRTEIDGTPHAILFSGDTVVAERYRQRSTLAGSFCHFMVRMLDTHRGIPCHWLLLSKGYRTYRFLPLYFKRFYPTCRTSTPSEYQRLMDGICRTKFGDYYNQSTGILQFGGNRDYLNAGVCDSDLLRCADRHVRFYLERNPGFRLGDELVCLADIAFGNFGRHIFRALQRTRVSWHE